jgi:teichuronic acid biosynthesis protein TuaE
VKFKYSYSFFKLEKLILFLAIFTGFFGSALFPINIGLFHLFPYRIFLILLWFMFIIHLLFKPESFSLLFKNSIFNLLFLFVWIFYGTLSLLWSASIGDGIRDWIFLFMGISTIIFSCFYLRSKKDFQIFFWLWMVTFLILIFNGFWEVKTGFHLPVSGYYRETRSWIMYRPTGIFHNPNDYAMYLTFSIPFALALISYNSFLWLKMLGVTMALSGFFLIVTTGSRANILAFFLQGFVFTLFFRSKARIALLICLILILGVFWNYDISSVKDFIGEIISAIESLRTQYKLGMGSVAVRLNLIKNGLHFLYSTAGFGVGPGNLEYYMANRAIYDTSGILNIHNWWFEVLINYGIFIFLGYLFFFFGIIRSLWRVWKKSIDRNEKMLAEALFISLVGFLISSISSSSIMAVTAHWLLYAFSVSFIKWAKTGDYKL